MFTRKALAKKIQETIDLLIENGIKPVRVILFGSYAKGEVHEFSDVDLAIWSPVFTGDIMNDLETIRPVLRKCRGIDFKLYPEHATKENYDSFIEVIESTGKVIFEQKNEKLQDHVNALT